MGFSFKVSDLDGLYAFTRMFDRAIASADVDGFECANHLASTDCFAPRFNGRRVFARNTRCGRNFYLWCGLLYDGASRMGLMVEMDAFSNQDVYADALKQIRPSDAYDIEKNEKHIKLFMPEARWAELTEWDAPAQLEALTRYFEACASAFAASVAR